MDLKHVPVPIDIYVWLCQGQGEFANECLVSAVSFVLADRCRGLVLQSHPVWMLSSLKRPLLLFSPNTLLLRWSVETLQLQISYAHQLQSWGRSGTSLRTGFGFSVSNRPLSVTPKGTAWIQSFISKIQRSSHRNTRIWSLWGDDHIHWAGWSGPTPSPSPNVTEVQE